MKSIKHRNNITSMIILALMLTSACVSLAAKAKKNSYKQQQYKRQGLNVIAQVVDGNYGSFVEDIQAYLEEHPDDLESWHCLAVLYAQLNQPENALQAAQTAVAKGLPAGRIMVGPRDLLSSLHKAPEYQTWFNTQHINLIHGPMVGSITDHSARIWVRTAKESFIQISVKDTQTNQIQKSKPAQSLQIRDYTATCYLTNLKPDTHYEYTIMIDGESLPGLYSFKTAPALDQPAKISFGFGGGAGFTPQYERIWTTIAGHDLTAFLFLGDNVYIDNPGKPACQLYCYYRRQSQPYYRTLVASTPIYAIWDDHDFTDNDNWGGPEIDKPAWKRDVWRVFKQNWVNPAYGGGEKNPGCWFSTKIADVDIIFLDGRYYRMNPRADNPSMLGPVQKAWLFDTLKKATGTFKILASPVPWTPGVKPGSRDPWDGYAAEREEIFSFLEANTIEGVILIAADRHRSDLWQIERPNGYDFYEFESSRLSNIHKHGPVKGNLFSYNEKCSFGKLTFDTTAADPTCTYEIYNIDNERVFTFTLKCSQLSY